MTRALGAALILVGGALCGLQAAAGLRGRVAVIEELVRALELMEREVSLKHTPLPELLGALARRTAAPAGALFSDCLAAMEQGRPFPQAWEQAVGRGPLGREERETLLFLAQVLGGYDAAGQGAAILRVRQELERRLPPLREETRSRSRVYLTLGVTAGGFLTLTLL